jgi:hypothetical protein
MQNREEIVRISKLILFAWVCFFYLGLTGPAAIPTKAAEIHTIPESSEKLFEKARLLIAADSSDGKEANDTGKTTENQSTPKTEKGTHKEKPSSKDNTDPLTTFEPTEKVKADQAVDFPYDI